MVFDIRALGTLIEDACETSETNPTPWLHPHPHISRIEEGCRRSLVGKTRPQRHFQLLHPLFLEIITFIASCLNPVSKH